MNLFTGFLIYMWMVFVISIIKTDNECNIYCTCNEHNKRKSYHTAVCAGKMLHYFPKLPHYITTLKMQNGNLTEIGEFAFKNLSTSKISKLILSGNKIRNINSKAFNLLPPLTSLAIENERSLNIDVLSKVLTTLDKTKLKTFRLKFNGWNHVFNDTFAAFARGRLGKFALTGNVFPFLSWSLFKYLQNCYKLDISANKIEQMMLISMPKLYSLNLNDNRLSEIPTFCTGNVSFVPALRSLYLNKNNIWHMTKESFQCIPKLESLKLNGILISRLENNVFGNLLSLKTLYLNDIVTLKRIEELAFNRTTLKKLSISNTNFRFDRLDRFNPETVFKFCSHLEHLNLNQNNFHDRQDILRTMLMQVSDLEYLSLSSSGLLGLPGNMFKHLLKLRKLISNDNAIHSLNENIFENVTSLKYLYLSSNLLKVINKTTFPNELLDSLTKIDLSLNPFTCDCYQKWFLNWLETTRVKVLGYPVYYRCSTPISLTETRLDEYHPTDEICNPFNPLHIMAIALTLFGFFTIFIIVVVCKCQVNIKNYIYLLRVRYSRNERNVLYENPTEYEYDAFVVYCDSDRLWVHKIFLHKIEKGEGIRLCIHQREFEAGETIAGNIDKYLKKCRKVVVIMSNNFAKSEWCQWEIDVVQERRRRQGKDVFLLIMLHNIDSKHMTSQLRTLLDSTPHIRYPEGLGETLFWEAAVETLRKPIGHPPIAVL